MKKYLVLLFMFLFCLTGCSLDRDVHLVRAGSHTFNHGSTYIIDSISDLNEYVVNTYNDFDKSVVEYDEEYFKNNLANDIFLQYFPEDSQSRRERYAEDVFDYIERYEDNSDKYEFYITTI